MLTSVVFLQLQGTFKTHSNFVSQQVQLFIIACVVKDSFFIGVENFQSFLDMSKHATKPRL